MSLAFSTGQTAVLACILEVTAPKPGNVHRAADFPDCTLNDFLASAVAIGPHMEDATNVSVGETVANAIQATRSVSNANTNLGIVLLLAPLAAATGRSQSLHSSVQSVLDELTPADSNQVYEAIRLARPGGMDSNTKNIHTEAMDLQHDAPDSLITAMRAAESYDMVARQYANGFTEVFEFVVPKLSDAVRIPHLNQRIVHTHLEIMAQFPDSLIQRKCGKTMAADSATRAAHVIAAGPVESEPYNSALADFDFWLRSDGNRRNPGTTADLIAAGLFVALLEGKIQPPFH